MSSPILSDDEIDDICAGLTKGAAKVRFIREVLKVPCERKPNGRPLVRRVDWERRHPPAQADRSTWGPKWSKPMP